MPHQNGSLLASFPRDLAAGLVVFLVALPLCIGVAQASGAPVLSGVLSGIVGGILVGLLSGSHTSVSGPAAGLAAVVAAQIVTLGSFPAFLLAVVFAGVIQLALALARAGFLTSFFPTSVIKGMVAATGVILILKQIPHLLGHDADPEGDMDFRQPDHETTFSELVQTAWDVHPGAALIGLLSVAVLIAWDVWKPLKAWAFLGPVVVVLLGVAISQALGPTGGAWVVGPGHRVEVPVPATLGELGRFLHSPDFSQWANPAVYAAALLIAAGGSLKSLLTLEAVDNLDPRQRVSPPSRELFAQGVGNVVCGLIGGLPVTSVIVRGSVNINAGARSKVSAIAHGVFLLVGVAVLPAAVNLIPMSCLAAVLLVTGVKLVSGTVVKRMWGEGWPQFVPFAVTVVAVVLTGPLVGVLAGLAVSVGFILRSSVLRPVRQFVERHLGGDVVRIELASQVSFLNRAALVRILDAIPRGGHVLLDAQNTDYIDPDVLDLLRDYADKTGPARRVRVSLVGFQERYQMVDQIQYVDYSTRDLQDAVSPRQVLQFLKDGNERFRTGRRLTRDLGRQVAATAGGQHPLAVVLSCIDSRNPAELIFDLGVGDIFSLRIAGNVTSRKVLASAEYACAVAGAKLILVVGHTRCGAVTAAVKLLGDPRSAAEATGCQHLDHIVNDIQQAADPVACRAAGQLPPAEQAAFVDDVARRNVARVVERIRADSRTLDALAREGRILVVGAMYDVATGGIEFLPRAEGGDTQP